MKKKLIKAACLLGAVVMACCGFTACAKFDPANPGDYFAIPEYADDTQISIGGFCGPSWYVMNERSWEDAFKEAKEQGFTVLYSSDFQMDFGVDPESAMEYMDLAYKYGMKVYVNDTSLGVPHLDGDINADKWDTAAAKEYTKHPAFAGVHLIDEPSYMRFDALGAKQKKWNEEFPDKMLLINLFPGYAGPTVLGGSFNSYLDNFIDTVKPDILHFDHYAVYADGSLGITYFSEHAKVAAKAKEADIPSGCYLMTTGHETGRFEYKRMQPTSYLRWQMAVSMTFGFKHITHYAFDPPWGGGYEATGYDHFYTDGEKNSLWHSVTEVNNEVLKWDNVYMNFDWIGTAPVVSPGNANLMFNVMEDGRIEPNEIKGVKSIVPTGDVLCGVFEDANSNTGYMITNATNPADELDVWAEVTFDKAYKGVLVYEKGVPAVMELDDDNKAVIALESGEGKFVIPLKKK